MEAHNPKLDNRDVPAAAGGGGLGAQQLMELGDRDGPAVAAGGGGGGGFMGALHQLIELGDRRLQAASFFLSGGSCMVIYSTVLNPSVNPEHALGGFLMFNVGAVLALLTLGGTRPGRAAARVEEALRGFF